MTSRESEPGRSNPERPITMLLAALGGEGGGVLSNWVVDAAESQGCLVQYTAIPGLAQRTGATSYYLEISEKARASSPQGEPVMALMPGPGDVDILVSTEIIEAGRMMQRRFLNSERSVVIASTHRTFAILEKSAMGDGRFDSESVIRAVGKMSQRFVHFDMAALAREAGSIINAVLFGALAGSGALPFPRGAFEDAISRGGIAVEANLKGFAAGFERAAGPDQAAPTENNKAAPPENNKAAPPENNKAVPAEDIMAAPAAPLPKALAERLEGEFPAPTRALLRAGLARLLDYQDEAYGVLYLDRLAPVLVVDGQSGGHERGWELTAETGRYLALWMAFEDIIRVADLKTRAARFERVRGEVGLEAGQILVVAEFLKPRAEEMSSLMPPWLARLFMETPALKRLLRRLEKGRTVRTTTVSGFLLMWTLARMRRWRRGTSRYQEEQILIDGWLKQVAASGGDYDLGLEIAALARLVKGYGETRERGQANFRHIMVALAGLRGTTEPAAAVRGLRESALADEDGASLGQELESLVQRLAREPLPAAGA